MMASEKAYTLIELLVAMALASALMVTVMTLLASLDRHQTQMKKATATLTLDHRLAEVITRDLLHAQRGIFLPNEIQLTSYHHLDPQTFSASHRPVQVIYRLHADEAGSCLVRDQYALDVTPSSAQARVSTSLLAWGVRQFAIAPIHESTTPENDAKPSWSTVQHDGRPGIQIERPPRQVEFTLQWDAPVERRHRRRLSIQ